MQYFTYNKELDRQVKVVHIRIRKLMNGETAQQLQNAGLKYKKLYGVSLVHLRQLSQQIKPCNLLAERLWHFQIREMMILATMIAQKDHLDEKKILYWTKDINNIELAEQISFNLLGKRQNSKNIIDKLIFYPNIYARYTGLMAAGWQYRFIGNEITQIIKENIQALETLATDLRLNKAVTHALKMAGRFDAEFRPTIISKAQSWRSTDSLQLKSASEEILFELQQ